jgi:hypothetical protein
MPRATRVPIDAGAGREIGADPSEIVALETDYWNDLGGFRDCASEPFGMRNPGPNRQRELVSFVGATAVMRGDAWIVLW